MSENTNTGSGDAAASIKSEKSKDIRSTNIIAAKGKYLLLSHILLWNHSKSTELALYCCSCG